MDLFYLHTFIISFRLNPTTWIFLFTYIYYITQTKPHHMDLFYLHTFIISLRLNRPHHIDLFYLHTFIIISFRQTPPHGPFLFTYIYYIIQTNPTTWTFFIHIHLLSFRQTPLHGPFLFTYIYYYIIQTKPHHMDLFYLDTFIILQTNPTTWTFFIYIHLLLYHSD